MPKLTSAFVGLTIGLAPPLARAQFQIDWYTIDGGGGTAIGGTFSLTGTIGQPDAGSAAGGGFECVGGFWGGSAAAVCYPNCDNSTTPPVLNVLDFVCFQSRFASADPYADCDHSSTFNVNDFVCFQAAFAAGCR